MEEPLEAPSAGGADRLWATIAYFGPLVVIPLFMRNKDRFVAFHTRQALYLFVLFIVAVGILLGALAPMRGVDSLATVFQILSVLMVVVVAAYALTLIILIAGAARGRMPMLPVLGEMAGEN